MSLNAQQQALADTLDALVRYVNRRQHLVREDPTQSDEERMLRQHLVLRFLWQHTSLLEDFVRENPEHLSAPLLAIAQGLEGVLYGSLFVEELLGEQHPSVENLGVNAFEEFGERHVKSLCDLDEVVDGDVAPALLDAYEVGAVERDHTREGVLGEVLAFAQELDAIAQVMANRGDVSLGLHAAQLTGDHKTTG